MCHGSHFPDCTLNPAASPCTLVFACSFPSMPCAVVSLDAMDASGQHQLEVMHDVFKQRLDR